MTDEKTELKAKIFDMIRERDSYQAKTVEINNKIQECLKKLEEMK